MERSTGTNKSQKIKSCCSFGVSLFQVLKFLWKVRKGNYTSQDVYGRSESEIDFQRKM
jgi:hypothetical protein